MKHVHAELIKLYAAQLIAWVEAGAAFAKHPAQHWEREDGTDNWYRYSTTTSPAFAESVNYRYNPRPKTVTRYLNDGTKVELPELLREEPEREAPYYFLVMDAVAWDRWNVHDRDIYRVRNGLTYKTREDAEVWLRYFNHLRTGVAFT